MEGLGKSGPGELELRTGGFLFKTLLKDSGNLDMAIAGARRWRFFVLEWLLKVLGNLCLDSCNSELVIL